MAESNNPFNSSNEGDSGTNKEFEKMVKRVEHARKIRARWEKDFNVVTAENYFIGKQDSNITLNHFFALVKAQHPNLFVRAPRFLARSRPGRKEPATERNRAFAEGILKSIADQDHHLEKATRLGLIQSFFRVGVLKVTFDPQMKENPRAGEPLPAVPGQEAGTEPDEIVTDDIYRFKWVNAKNMLFPDQGPDMDCWTWLGEEIVVTLEEAKEDRRFTPSLRRKLKSNESQRFKAETDEMGGEINNPDDPDAEPEPLFRYVEMYDLLLGKQYIFAEGQEFKDFLVNDDVPEGIEDHPYSILPGYTPIEAPIPLPWPYPHSAAWIDPQKEYNIRRQQIMEGAKRSARKLIYWASSFARPDEAVKALQSPYDLEAIEGQNPAHMPLVIDVGSVPQGVFADVALLQSDQRIIAGQTGPRTGGTEKSTATEAGFVERAANVRDVDMQAQVNLWLAEAGQKMFQLVSKTMTAPMWVTIKGLGDTDIREFFKNFYGLDPALLDGLPNLKQSLQLQLGQEKPFAVGREQLEFQADIEVVPSSPRPRNLEAEKREVLEFLTVFGQFPQLALSRELMMEIQAKYEFISDRMADELFALAQKMIEINQKTAGREQGGENKDDPVSQVANLIGATSQGVQ